MHIYLFIYIYVHIILHKICLYEYNICNNMHMHIHIKGGQTVATNMFQIIAKSIILEFIFIDKFYHYFI